MDPADPADVAASLALVLDAVDCGDLDATPDQRAYLAGALDTARRFVGTHSVDE